MFLIYTPERLHSLSAVFLSFPFQSSLAPEAFTSLCKASCIVLSRTGTATLEFPQSARKSKMLSLIAYAYSAVPLSVSPQLTSKFIINHKPGKVPLPKEWVIDEQVSSRISVKATGSKCSLSNSNSLSNTKITVRSLLDFPRIQCHPQFH